MLNANQLNSVIKTNAYLKSVIFGLYPFFSLLKIQPSGTAFAPAKSHTFKRRE